MKPWKHDGEIAPSLVLRKVDKVLLAYRKIKSNTGSSTEGTDGITIGKYKIENQEEFIKEIRETLEDYKPQMIRRVEIPKPNGKKRALGILHLVRIYTKFVL